MGTTTAFCFSPAKSSSSSSCLSTLTIRPHKPIISVLCPNFFKPNPTLTLPRLRVSLATAVVPKRKNWVSVVSERQHEAESSDSNAGATIDIKLPRRSLLVQFTCDECGERTQRLINRLAYERGLVYVQCAGCLRHHKLVDNLGLVVDYDLREENNVESNTDQV